MDALTLGQLRLLRLCAREVGPFVGEFEEFSKHYGLDRTKVRQDYIVLLVNKLVRPLCSIYYADSYLPSHCLITEQGKRAHDDGWRKHPDIEVHVFVGWNDDTPKSECFDVLTRDWPTIDKMELDELAELAEVYLYWAQEAETGGETGVRKRDLYEAAAHGFGRVGDSRRYIKAVRGHFAAEVEDGRYLNLAITGGHLLERFPSFADATLACLSSALKEPYRDLTGDDLPSVSQANYRGFLQEFVRKAVDAGAVYSFHAPKKNPLIGISNRIEDILGKAFETSNQNLFLQTMHLQYLFVDVIESMVHIPESARDFENRVGYRRCAERAKNICGALECFAPLVGLPEPQRKIAYQAALEIVRITQRLFAVPVWDSCDREDSIENRAGFWTFSLIGLPDRRVVDKLLPHFDRLETLASQLCPQDTKVEEAVARVFDGDSIQNDLREIKTALARVDQNTGVVRDVLLEELREFLGGILLLSKFNAAMLVEICPMILHSTILLEAIDSELNQSIGELRSDIAAWTDTIRHASDLAEEHKQSFLKQISEIAKLESAGQIVASIPLIPGFVEYKTTLGTKIDLNKWIAKLGKLFSGSSQACRQ